MMKCPELCDPLRPGFHSGGSGGGGHGGDEDESLHSVKTRNGSALSTYPPALSLYSRLSPLTSEISKCATT